MAYTIIIRFVNGMIFVRGIVSTAVTVSVNVLGSRIKIVIHIAITIVAAMSGSLS